MIDHQEHDSARMGSERSFGLVFAGVFLIVALWPLTHAAGPRWWALAIAAALAGVAVFVPAVLGPLNILWFRFGMLLGRMVGPIVMALIFFISVTPTGLVFRLRRKDLLALDRDSTARSYWATRDESVVGSMRNQF